MNKDTIRKEMLEKRLQLSLVRLDQIGKFAVQEIRNHPFYHEATHIGMYHPIKNEINIIDLIKDDLKTFYLPKVFGQNMHYLLYEDTLKQSELGIYEPVSEDVYDKHLELIIVPALAVDNQKHRVGYGKGYFDRFMELFPNVKTLGVVMSFQVVEEISYSLHDKKLHDIIIIPYED